jgi:hypothetical protein
LEILSDNNERLDDLPLDPLDPASEILTGYKQAAAAIT